MFLDYFHPPSATYNRLAEVYEKRWCVSSLPGGYVPYLTFSACSNLKWLSKQVPARVHLVNVRLHFNGWHTECRYQRRDTLCRFCMKEDSEDRIEHFLVCEWVNSCFPPHWKEGDPPIVPTGKFFLLCLTDDEKIAMSVFIYALYTVCNELRHSCIRPELKQTLLRTMGEVYLRPSVRKVWDGIFGFPRPPER